MPSCAHACACCDVHDVHCLPNLAISRYRFPSPRALCRRDDSTWSMTRWAPSEAARLFIVRSTSYGIYLHMTVHGLRRSCSGVFVIVIACLSPPPPSPPPPSLPPSPPPPPPPRTKTQQSLCEPPCAPCANTAMRQALHAPSRLRLREARALGAMMCAWHCLHTLLLPSIGSPFSFTACALQA